MDERQEPRFRPALLARRQAAGGSLVRVIVEPSPELYATYRSPGQYVEMRIGAATGFFVIASEPEQVPWHLLMRAGGGASDVVLAMEPGSPIELTGALGQGFPMDDVSGQPLAIALNGTGVAAGPPLVRRRLRDGDAARTSLFVGIRARDELPIEDELRTWAGAGVDVTVCLSQDDLEHGRDGAIRFARGRLQDVLRARFAGALTGTPIFAVGASSMIEALRELAPELGISGVHTNV